MRNDKPVEICYYSSDYYAPYTGISMYSLCKNNEGVPFTIGCIDAGISDKNKEKMLGMAREFNRELVFHSFTELESFIRDELKLPLCNGSYATYIKVFPDRIFKGIDRIFFMDGDTIINGSIQPLLDIDLEGHVFSAAKVALINDAWVYLENRPDNVRLQYALKFCGYGYYNIGVCYINLRRWAEVDFGGQIMEMREKHIDAITQAPDVPIDEVLFNLVVLENKEAQYAKPFSPQYNSVVHQIPHYRGLRANLMCGYIDKEEFNKAWYKPVVIHYCIFKPWTTDTFSPYRKILNRYKRNSPWPDAFTQTHYNSKVDQYFGKFVYGLPIEKLMRFTVSSGHFYLRCRARTKARIAAIRERICERSQALREKNPPYWIYALKCRGKFLLTGNFGKAFALPKRFKRNKE